VNAVADRAMRVLVTGGAGCIGSTVVDLLVDQGHEVVVVDRLHPAAHRSAPDYLNPQADYHWTDVRDREGLRPLTSGIDAVCHQASMVGLGVDFEDAPGYVSDNGLGTATLLAALHENGFRGRLVLASSMVVYGEGAYRCSDHGPVRPARRRPIDLDHGRFDPGCPTCGRPVDPVAVTEDAPLDPRNVYAATKLHQEQLCAAYGHEHASPVVALRYHNVYGPRMPSDTPYAGVASIFRSAAERGEAPRVFEDGGQRRDFVHVHDVARANLAALVAGDEVVGSFNVASGHPHTILELATALAGEAGNGLDPKVVGGYRLGDVRHVFACPDRARQDLGFIAQVDFETGIRELANAPLRA
jgi:dTDP-L-rhamnose 4-epimerase